MCKTPETHEHKRYMRVYTYMYVLHSCELEGEMMGLLGLAYIDEHKFTYIYVHICMFSKHKSQQFHQSCRLIYLGT